MDTFSPPPIYPEFSPEKTSGLKWPIFLGVILIIAAIGISVWFLLFKNKTEESKNPIPAVTITEPMDVSLVGQVVEYIDKLSAFRIVLLDPETFKVIVKNNAQKQAMIFLKNAKNAVPKDFYDNEKIKDGRYVIRINGKIEPEKEGDSYSVVYAEKIEQTVWMRQYEHYGISLLYPTTWQAGNMLDGYSDSNTPIEYVDKSGGFFSVNIIEGETSSDEGVAVEAYSYANSGNRYGSKPELKITKISGQVAVIIIPSSDQADKLYPKGHMTAIIKYPKPLELEASCGEWDCAPGQNTYIRNFGSIALSADKDNFQNILDSVRFTQ